MNRIEDEIRWNEYLITGTEVLKNKLNIVDKEKLKKIEREIVRKKLAYLYLNPIKGNFDKEHLLNVHKFIFDEIYPFAGQIRTCTLQKDIHEFCKPEEIENNLKLVLHQMNEEFDNSDIYSIQEFAYKLGKYYYEIQYIHPFREGNGRSVRSFFRDFVVEKSKNKSCGPLDLDYTKLDKNNLILGTALRYVYPSYIEIEFMKGLVPIEKNKIK
ncbi:MAG: hypothetical protein E7174_00445 [Firmicutes bacterium]|nr:hypothetical protein [Bacillota bacterium]